MITIGIIAVTVITSVLAFGNEEVYLRALFNPYVIDKRNQYYRFISSGLIHADFMHLGFNMIALYFFGLSTEIFFSEHFEGIGTLLYIALYISGLIMSQTYSFYKHKNNPRYNALGASGAVSAVIFCSIMIDPQQGIGIFPFTLVFRYGIPGYIFGPLYLWYSWYMGKRGMDNIGHDAHFFGAVWGILFIIVSWPQVVPHFIEQIFG